MVLQLDFFCQRCRLQFWFEEFDFSDYPAIAYSQICVLRAGISDPSSKRISLISFRTARLFIAVLQLQNPYQTSRFLKL
jgi:hypothetical protein